MDEFIGSNAFRKAVLWATLVIVFPGVVLGKGNATELPPSSHGKFTIRCGGLLTHVLTTLVARRGGRSEQALARDYLGDHKYQEAAWSLRRAGKIAAAEKIEFKTALLLKSGAVRVIQELRGDTQPLLVELPDGVRAVFKSASEGDEHYKHEMAAYRLNQLFGFDFVPITVERMIGSKKGSLQYFVRGHHPAAGFAAIDPKVGFFDFIIGNKDRYDLNIIIADKGREIVIDNGKAFKDERLTVENFKEAFLMMLDSPFESINPGISTLQRIRSISDDEIRGTLKPFLNKRQIEQLIDRKQYLLHAF